MHCPHNFQEFIVLLIHSLAFIFISEYVMSMLCYDEHHMVLFDESSESQQNRSDEKKLHEEFKICRRQLEQRMLQNGLRLNHSPETQPEQTALAIVETGTQLSPKNPYTLSSGLRKTLESFFGRISPDYPINNPPIESFVRDPENVVRTDIVEVPIYFEDYVLNCREARQFLLDTMANKSYRIAGEVFEYDLATYEGFVMWLQDAHKVSVHGQSGHDYYRTGVTPGKFHTKEKINQYYQDGQFDEVVRWAKLLNDPFVKAQDSTVMVYLPGIPVNGLPTTQRQSFHEYPGAEFHEFYLKKMHTTFLRASQAKNTVTAIENIAEFLQYAANSHVFEQVNFSIFMNMTNVMLEKHGIPGIPHDHIDFAAMALQPAAFVKFFVAKISQSQIPNEKSRSRVVLEKTQLQPTTLQLISGIEITVTCHMPYQLQISIQEPSLQAPSLEEAFWSDKNTQKWSSGDLSGTWYNSTTYPFRTYHIFENGLTEEDVVTLSNMSRYDIMHGYLSICGDNKYVFIAKSTYLPYEESQERVPLSPTEILKGIAILRQQQLSFGKPFSIEADNDNLSDLLLVNTNELIRSRNPFVILPQQREAKEGRRSQHMKQEVVDLLKVLLNETGEVIPQYQLSYQDIISRGARGMVYKRETKESISIVKTFPLLRPDDLFQLAILIGNKKLDGFPEVYNLCLVNGQLGIEMEFIPDLQPLTQFTGELTESVIQQALQNLRNFEATTGQTHDDLHEENIQVQTIIDKNGEPQHKVWLLDPCGISLQMDRMSRFSEVSELRKKLITTNLRNRTVLNSTA